jgi:hypothetical protein
MREYKFRGKRIDNGEWVYGYYFIEERDIEDGIISAIARKVDCEWNTAKAYIDKYPTIKQAYDNECQTILDMAETGLYKAIREGKDWAIKYILSTNN